MPDKRLVVLLAEDSEHDIRAVRRIWKKSALANPLVIVADGAECMDYLLRRNHFDDPKANPCPDVLLLDINLPKIDGFEVLRRIKQSDKLRRLPVVVLTSSTREEDMRRAYDLGANAFISKPNGMREMSALLDIILQFWEVAGRPVRCAHD